MRNGQHRRGGDAFGRKLTVGGKREERGLIERRITKRKRLGEIL